MLARGVTFVLGAVLLVLMWRRRSFALAVAAALVLAPIVWSTTTRSPQSPSGSPGRGCPAVWFLPLTTWGLPSSGIAADQIWGVAALLLVFAAVLCSPARAERKASLKLG